MLPEIVDTLDGSKTLLNKALNETYHSVNGAVPESLHIFIEAGLHHLVQNRKDQTQPISILEIGFGTGLNAFLTCLESSKIQNQIYYDGIENFPLPAELTKSLLYHKNFDAEQGRIFDLILQMEWNKPAQVSPYFILTKLQQSILDFQPKEKYNLVYFDAFGPDKQPEMWTETIFEKMFNCLLPGGILVTYSAKGDVKRALRQVGFEVTRLAGPPMKRHMLRAQKV